MSRQKLCCPDCGRTLAYKRQGGSIVPVAPLLLQRLNPDGCLFLYCDQEGCEGVIVVNGGPLIIPPRERATIITN